MCTCMFVNTAGPQLAQLYLIIFFKCLFSISIQIKCNLNNLCDGKKTFMQILPSLLDSVMHKINQITEINNTGSVKV